MSRSLVVMAMITGLVSDASAQEPVDMDMTSRIINEGLHISEAPALYTTLTNVIGP